MRRKKEDAEKTRETVLSAAVKVFREKGVSRATLEDIANQAGTTRGAIYWHCKNKMDIFQELGLGLSKPFEHILVPLLTGSDPSPSALKDALIKFLLPVEKDEDISAVLEIYYFKLEVGPDLEAFWGDARRESEDFIHYLTDFFTRAERNQALKEAVSPRHAAMGLIALFNGLIELKLMHKAKVSLPDSAEAVLDVFFSGLEP